MTPTERLLRDRLLKMDDRLASKRAAVERVLDESGATVARFASSSPS